MKKYFVYELKKSLFVMCALAVIAAAVYVITVLSNAEYLLGGNAHFPVEAITIVGGVLCVIVPVWKLSYRMKKRSVDLYYALPLSHTRILAVKFVVGLIAVFAPYTVAYWIGSFTAMAAAGKALSSVNFVPLYFATLIPMAITYVLTSFIFTRANRFIDGIAFIVLTGMSLAVVAEVVAAFVQSSSVYINSGFYTPFGGLTVVSEYYAYTLIKGMSVEMQFDAQDIVGLAVVAVCAAAAGIGLFLAEKRAKAENCEQISDSYFGFKVMIPLYTFSLALLGALDSYVLVALVAAASYAVSVLYRRTPKIGWKYAVVIAVAFIAGVALSFAVDI